MESAMFCCITKTFCPETLKLLWGSFYWNPCWNRCEYRDSRVSENKWEPFYWDINYQSSVIPEQRWKVLSISLILRKRMAMEARNSVSLSQIYFPIVIEATHTNFNMFSQWTHIAVQLTITMKTIRWKTFWPKIFGKFPYVTFKKLPRIWVASSKTSMEEFIF